ncbi:MAG: UpxY family transcription antiterminator [Candidatus Marinimicrobia bacterium]|jgi:transcription antitermination factor NusG|nr:UpxY family transcription antiterminator [Candidatus Neomarinimicrobiota bacterium]MBT3502455.1 UpxY family transcription antiterminator [Candidatus Neomarinimicrobiota bacterium]MBT3999080.1 UpxY family transcription antiterminator [Candidatus Neomarinimicrobiota bacterium]MBT4283368.1 UpxY family transcription antiterminator [Candidatus Neomarinimicrobiota bacterium]MBT4579843.1 UpxY family transcription antiterminator [Candidatus Neomarinimicrobiota bacterium]
MEDDQILKYWIAVYTKPRHEKTVENELQKKGYEVYLPLLKERRKWSDRKVWVEFPMFRSYIFVKTELKNALFVLQTIGVVKVIKFGGEVAVVQDSSIQAIKLMIEGGYIPEATDYFVKGDPVEVKEGPLKGLIGEITRVDNHDRFLVRVDAIQHSVSIQIDRGYLKSI